MRISGGRALLPVNYPDRIGGDVNPVPEFFLWGENCAGQGYAKKKFGNKFSVKMYDLEKKLRHSLLVLASWHL